MGHASSWTVAIEVFLALLPACTGADTVERVGPPPERFTVEVIDTVPHDPDAFTQGLELDGNRLIESTGQYGASDVRSVDPETGEVELIERLGDQFFAEGVTVIGNRLVQLTWKEQRAFVRDAATFEILDEWSYDGEGWGICAYRGDLVMSDGSSELTVRDSEDFSVLRRVGVTIEGEPVERLNELECDDETGVIWSNVWQTDEILRIEPDTGWVTGLVDASGLLDPAEATNADVLNGIAATPDGTFLITGKWWPWLFEVRFDTPN